MIILTSTKGDNVTVFVHKELLCFFSTYYAAAPNGNSSETHKAYPKVDLHGKELESFVAWLYTGEILEHDDATFCALDLYLFADLVDIMALHRAAISHVMKHVGDKPDVALELSYRDATYMLEHTAESSPLQK
ncbi:unnamed protein product [Aureobasidium vineae]|uniref:BTB domain-containing protein n=1 Tax=Aureobasidium vineae TaxID=2773715 RepID=A0A9N8JPG3_9PEZI|nr:unnamed protein product [Aureobasidium vineae]